MATRLEKTLKREISIDGQAYMLAVSPDGLKLTLKGRRKGVEVGWKALVGGDTALAAGLNASPDHESGEAPDADDSSSDE